MLWNTSWSWKTMPWWWTASSPPSLLGWLSKRRGCSLSRGWTSSCTSTQVFESQVPILVELFAVTLLLTLVFHAILTRLQKTGAQSKHWLSFSFLYLSILIALLLLGRQHWIQWRRLHPQLYLRKDAPNHGTPAVLYPRQRLLGAAQFLEQNIDTSTPFDLALGKYRRKLGIAGHLLEPNLVRHVGALSTFGEAYDQKFRGQRELEVKYQVCA